MSLIPESHKELLEKAIVISLVTVMPDGDPQVTPVWCDLLDGHIRVNTARGRQKDHNLHERPIVAVLAVDPTNPMRWIEVRGEVVGENDDQTAARAHISLLSGIYRNKPDYFEGNERALKETRVIYTIRPTKVNTSG